MIATQFNNLSISGCNGSNRGAPSSPQSPDAKIATMVKDCETAAASPSPKKNKKGRKKTGQRPAVNTNAASSSIDTESTFTKSNQIHETTKRMIADVASSHVKNQDVHLEDAVESKSSKPKKNSTTPRKSKKKNRKNSKNKDGVIWDNVQQYSDYSTNAEGAAILASLGQFQFAPPTNNGGYHQSNNDYDYHHSSESYDIMTENAPYEVAAGPVPSEYYEGSSAAIAAMSYYYPQPTNHHVVPPAVDAAASYPAPACTSAGQQPSPVNTINPYPTTYGYYPYPMYYVPVHQVPMQESNGMYCCPPSPPQQHQYDENTPPSEMGGNGVVMPHQPVTVQEKAKLNVDAPTFEPKKGGQ